MSLERCGTEYSVLDVLVGLGVTITKERGGAEKEVSEMIHKSLLMVLRFTDV